jgi:hypothetical protein
MPDLLENKASSEEVSNRRRLPFTVGTSREDSDLTFLIVLFLERVLIGKIIDESFRVIGFSI